MKQNAVQAVLASVAQRDMASLYKLAFHSFNLLFLFDFLYSGLFCGQQNKNIPCE